MYPIGNRRNRCKGQETEKTDLKGRKETEKTDVKGSKQEKHFKRAEKKRNK